MDVQTLIKRIAARLNAMGKSKAEFARELNAYLPTPRGDTIGCRITVYRWFSFKNQPRPEVLLAMQEWERAQTKANKTK